MVTRVQILDEVDGVSFCAIALWKRLESVGSLSAMGK